MSTIKSSRPNYGSFFISSGFASLVVSGVFAAPAVPATQSGPRPGEKHTFANIEFAWVPPGRFLMGSKWTAEEVANRSGGKAEWFGDERPSHPVSVSAGFWMGVHEVVNRDFEAFVKATGYKTTAEQEGKGRELPKQP